MTVTCAPEKSVHFLWARLIHFCWLRGRFKHSWQRRHIWILIFQGFVFCWGDTIIWTALTFFFVFMFDIMSRRYLLSGENKRRALLSTSVYCAVLDLSYMGGECGRCCTPGSPSLVMSVGSIGGPAAYKLIGKGPGLSLVVMFRMFFLGRHWSWIKRQSLISRTCWLVSLLLCGGQKILCQNTLLIQRGMGSTI